MIELRDDARFPLEALTTAWVGRDMRAQDLDRDNAIESRVARLVDLAHTTGAEVHDDFVRTEVSPSQESHRRY
jgi:hypothetical protein